jgi:hypothetical protein
VRPQRGWQGCRLFERNHGSVRQDRELDRVKLSWIGAEIERGRVDYPKGIVGVARTSVRPSFEPLPISSESQSFEPPFDSKSLIRRIDQRRDLQVIARVLARPTLAAMPPMTCPKCGSEMEIGFVADATYGGFVVPQWVSGRAERTFWGGLRLRGRKRRWVDTHRCTRCGYLEAYANQG